MKRLQGGFGIGALVWVSRAVVVGAACLVSHAGMAQSVRLVPTAERFAGTGTAQDSGPANSTILNGPTYVTTDASADVFIADTGNNCVRRADNSITHNMTVAAGQPVAGGNDTCQNPGSVTATDPTTGVLQPSGVAVDSIGNLFIADTGHNCIRRLAAGDTGGTADLTTVVGTCGNLTSASVTPAPAGLALDSRGNLYISINDVADGIYQVLRSNQPAYNTVCIVAGAISANVSTYCNASTPPTLNAPMGLTIDPLGNLYMADSGNACIRKLSSGMVTTAVGKCSNDGTGSPSTTLQKPVSVASDAAGHLYITDTKAAQVFELEAGSLSAIAGNGTTGSYNSTAQDGQAAASIPLNGAAGLATDRSGNVYLAETGNNIVRLLTQGLNFPTTGVGSQSQLQILQFLITSAVNLSITEGGDYQVLNDFCSGSHPAPTPGTSETCLMSFYFKPTLPGLRTSPLTFSDSKTTPATLYTFGLSGVGQSAEAIFAPGTINTLASSLASPSAVAIDSVGDVYFAESSSGAISVLPAGSGTPTQLVAPGGSITTPTALTLDAAGNLYIADSTANSIFRYDVNGNLTTVASGLDNPVALAIDQLGDLYVAEDGVSTVGVLEIYAGGQQAVISGQGLISQPDNVPAINAKFVHPSALYLDPSGNLYVGDRGGYRVYLIDVSGTIHRFAGNGTATDASNPKAKTDFGLAGIAGIGSDPGGDISIADATNNRVVLVFSGLAANPEAEVLVGDGTAGYTGDGGPANKAELNSPMAVAVDGSAEVFLADTGNGALRKITYQEPILNFGTVKVGQTSGPLGTTLWNAGNSSLAPVAPILDDTVDFSEDTADSNCPSTIPAGSTCNLYYLFTPKAPGSYVKHANLADSSANPRQTITLIATVPPPPVATVAATGVTVVYGDAYTLAASITGNQGAGSEPTGTATFSIGAATLCPVQPVPTSGAVSCSPSPTLEDVGTYTVTVSYSGDSNYPASQTTITLIVTPRPVTITADNKTRPVNTANPPLTGTVVNVVPGQSITAAYSTTAVTSSPAGTYPITPAYTFGVGTKASNYAVTVVNGTLTITTSTTGGGGGSPPGGGGGNPPGGGSGSGGSFTLATTPPEQEIDHNGTVNYVVTLGSTGGFTGPVTLACSGLPENATCAFAPASVTLASGASGTSTMTITATADNTNVPTVFSNMRSTPVEPSHGSPLLAWTMLPLGMLFGVRHRRRLFLLLVPFALLAAALGTTGCASPSNYKIYTVTVTGTATSGGATVTQSSTVDFVLAR
jgi:sugar lactone lactonase YvrE